MNSSTTDATGMFAQSVLAVADQVEQAELKLKQSILEAAGAGDCQTIIAIVSRWLTEPVIDVAAALTTDLPPTRIDGLDACGEVEVTQGTPPSQIADGA